MPGSLQRSAACIALVLPQRSLELHCRVEGRARHQGGWMGGRLPLEVPLGAGPCCRETEGSCEVSVRLELSVNDVR